MRVSRDQDTGKTADRRWPLLAVVLIGVCAAGLLIHALSYNYVVDDAYISFRYARNLTEGRGLVFNPGERVEGYTNFLWVLVIALGIGLRSDPVGLAKTLCFGFGLISMVTVYYYYGRVYLRRGWDRLVPAGLMAVSPPLAVWALGGLETTMFAFLITAAVLTHLDSREQGTARELRPGRTGRAYQARGHGLRGDSLGRHVVETAPDEACHHVAGAARLDLCTVLRLAL
jgi:hypothetical protein